MLLIHDGAKSCPSKTQVDVAFDEKMQRIHGTSPKYLIIGFHLLYIGQMC